MYAYMPCEPPLRCCCCCCWCGRAPQAGRGWICMTVRKKRKKKKASLLCTAKDRVEFVVRNIPRAAHAQHCSPTLGQRDGGQTELSRAWLQSGHAGPLLYTDLWRRSGGDKRGCACFARVLSRFYPPSLQSCTSSRRPIEPNSKQKLSSRDETHTRLER